MVKSYSNIEFANAKLLYLASFYGPQTLSHKNKAVDELAKQVSDISRKNNGKKLPTDFSKVRIGLLLFALPCDSFSWKVRIEFLPFGLQCLFDWLIVCLFFWNVRIGFLPFLTMCLFFSKVRIGLLLFALACDFFSKVRVEFLPFSLPWDLLCIFFLVCFVFVSCFCLFLCLFVFVFVFWFVLFCFVLCLKSNNWVLTLFLLKVRIELLPFALPCDFSSKVRVEFLPFSLPLGFFF